MATSRQPILPVRLIRNPWVIQLVATAGFIGLVLWRANVGELSKVAEPLRHAHYEWLLLALLAFISTKFIDAVRWDVYLARVGKVPISELLGTLVIANFGNNMLPMRVGDIAKIQIIANRHGLSRAGLASAVFIVGSVMDGVTFLSLLLVGLAFLDIGFLPASSLWALAVFALGGFIATILVSNYLPRDLLERWWFLLLSERLRRALGDLWPKFLDGLGIMRDRRLLAKGFVLNFVSWLIEVIMFWMFGLALGLDIHFPMYIVIMVAVNVVSAFPVTFQNLGTYEVALLEILVTQGVDRQEAFAYAIFAHVLTNLWITALGLLSIWLMHVRPREVFSIRQPVA